MRKRHVLHVMRSEWRKTKKTPAQLGTMLIVPLVSVLFLSWCMSYVHVMVDSYHATVYLPDEETLNRLTDSVNTEWLGIHPVPMRREDVKRIYRKAFLKAGEAERQACVDIWRYYGS